MSVGFLLTSKDVQTMRAGKNESPLTKKKVTFREAAMSSINSRWREEALAGGKPVAAHP